jgi:hypothetical protein
MRRKTEKTKNLRKKNEKSDRLSGKTVESKRLIVMKKTEGSEQQRNNWGECEIQKKARD